MLSPETLERQISAVMESLLEAAVTELSRLVVGGGRWAGAMAALPRSAPETALKREEEDAVHSSNITSQIASVMETWAKDAVEKIVMTLKVALCEADEEQKPWLNDNTVQKTTKLKAEQQEGPKRQSHPRNSCHKRKKIEKGLDPARGNKIAHLSSQADAATGESSSRSLFDPQVTEPVSHVTTEDPIRGDASTLSTASEMKEKKTSGPFKCPSCEKSFALKCLLARHHLTHSKPHLCPECGKRFSGLRGLTAHARRHSGEKPYKCSDCGTEFAYKYTLTRHMRQHNLKKISTHTCVLCENQFSGASALQRHTCGALKKTFVCSLCPDTFECRQRLADHENLHSGDRAFVCEMCGESFFSSSSLATHRVTHIQKVNCCDLLGLGCSDSRVLRNHLSKHTGEKLFPCEVCGKGCSHQSALKHHMLTHTGEKPFVCETCGKRCSHASALQNHVRIHTGKKPGQQPVCSVCGKTFRCMVNLKYHMSMHTGEKPYACDQCDKKFSNPSNLKLHTVIHTGEKMYGCFICGRRFTQSSSLKLHRRIHTGEKPHSCPVCRKGFIHSGDLKKHQRGHMPDEHEDGQAGKTAGET